MPKTEETWMGGITTEMMEHICDILNQYNRCNDFDNSQCAKLLKRMHELKERDAAKKPDIEGDGYDDSGNLIYDTWICPNCETRYEVDYDHYDFCPNCGQRIDWSKE